MPSVYQPRRPRASPLWQIVHHGWTVFLADYERHHRKSLGPLRPNTVTTVQSFLCCGDLASGFTRLQCPDCGHERLLAFTCKARHFCPACHQRRTRTIGEWIATAVCHEVPHRQFVLTPSPPAQSALAGQPSGQSVSLASRRLGSPSPRSCAASSTNAATSSPTVSRDHSMETLRRR